MIQKRSRAECDIVRDGRISLAGERASEVIVGVAVSLWAGLLENLRIVHRPVRRLACFGPVVRSAAAVFVGVERRACALTCDGGAVFAKLQFRRTDGVEVGRAASGGTVVFGAFRWNPRAFYCGDAHRQIVSIDKANVVEVEVARSVEREFGERCWRFTAGTLALLTMTAVACFAYAVDAVRASPETATPVIGKLDCV